MSTERLEQIGHEIEAWVEKLDKVGGKAVDYRDTIDRLLEEADKLCGDKDAFESFKDRHCPKLKNSRTYELLAIQQGKKTVEDIRAETRARVAKHRAAKKAVTEKDSVTSKSAMPIHWSKRVHPDVAYEAHRRGVTARAVIEGQHEKRDPVASAVERQVDDVIAKLPSSWETAEKSAEIRKAQYAAAEKKSEQPRPERDPIESQTNYFNREIGDFIRDFEPRFRSWFESSSLADDARASLHDMLMQAADTLMTLAQEVDGRGAVDKAAA